jgi:hypothetical protein
VPMGLAISSISSMGSSHQKSRRPGRKAPGV